MVVQELLFESFELKDLGSVVNQIAWVQIQISTLLAVGLEKFLDPSVSQFSHPHMGYIISTDSYDCEVSVR